MRIISGHLRGRRLIPVHGRATRPTSDRTREALFNILGPRVLGRRVLDLFAGTGALAIEALSRGAQSALLVDNAGPALATIRKNVARCGLTDVATVRRWDLRRRPVLLADYPGFFDLVFLDPPYHQQLIDDTLVHLHECGALAARAVIVAEHHRTDHLEPPAAHYRLQDQRRYGKTLVSFFQYML
ncbi:MAG: 16S rRNA (guanine(966)-N(2))-methyltransferase RsmD [Desulfosarcinaceae bacterium]|nr:16S rRNA (guanine(966)-N(2))-methyltransferase RsmD [Desulfosarcinaceae bacterium]